MLSKNHQTIIIDRTLNNPRFAYFKKSTNRVPKLKAKGNLACYVTNNRAFRKCFFHPSPSPQKKYSRKGFAEKDASLWINANYGFLILNKTEETCF
jgi:hypothetical protein